MQLNSKWMITALTGVASIAAVALLVMLSMWGARPTQTEFSEPSSNAAATTEDSNVSPATPGDTVANLNPDAPREARAKDGRLGRVPRESRERSTAPVGPSSASSVEEVADSYMPPKETGESSGDQAVIASPPAPEVSHASTYVEAPLPVTPGKSYVSSHMSGRASTLLAEIGAQGAGLKLHAETLESFARHNQHSWQSHAYYLERVKEHINAAGERLAELQQIRHAVLPWQLQAITEVTSHAEQVAASTRAAIIHLRQNQNRLFVSEYRDHLKAIADRSDDMKETTDKYLDYEKTQEKFQLLQDELEL